MCIRDRFLIGLCYTENMNIDLLDFDEETIPEELEEVGSYNHSYFQIDLALRLLQSGEFTVLPELSLDTENLKDGTLRSAFKLELKPDLSVYPLRPKPNPHDDILRMTEMPLLIVEVLSPMQSFHKLSRKVKAYFVLGVKSCWIVSPQQQAVTVYQKADQSITYGTNQTVVDDVIGIKIPISDIF